MAVKTQADAMQAVQDMLALKVALAAMLPKLEELHATAMRVAYAGRTLPQHETRFRTAEMFERMGDAEDASKAAVVGYWKAQNRFTAEIDMLCDQFGLRAVGGQVRVFKRVPDGTQEEVAE